MYRITRNYNGLNKTLGHYNDIDARLDSRATHLSASDNLLVAAIEEGIPIDRIPGKLRRRRNRPYRPLRDMLMVM